MFHRASLRAILTGFAGAAMVVWMAACTPSARTPSPQSTVPPGVTPTPTLEPTPTEAIVSLNLWMPASLAPAGAGDAARVLDAQLAEFDARHTDATLEVVPKIDQGPGGLLDLLRAASPVAPSALPDVILLSDADLAIAAREGLIQPLDGLLDAESEANLFAFARNSARIDNKRMGLPLTADVNHLVFIPDRLTTPPADWTELISGTLAFPFAFADGAHVSDAVLADYEMLGGVTINDEGQPALALDALTQLLTTYRDARAAGVLASTYFDWPDPNAAWAAFRSTNAALTIGRASRYLSTSASAAAGAATLNFARVPPITGDLTPPIGRTWNLALVARDPRRQALAIELIKYLSRADNAAAWTQAAHILPASAAALTLWGSDEEYAAFVRGELNRAVPPPSPAALDAVSPAFLSAIREVLIGRATPETAAQAAVEAVARGEK
jgi:ABC-type glycerol-3-phosphate transport system substrate-binding protein